MPTLTTQPSHSFPYPSGVSDPPYYAAVFTSLRRPDAKGYETTAQRIVELARMQPGFLGVESVNNAPIALASGEQEAADAIRSITVSYWRDLEAIERWRKNSEHVMARAKGRAEWYERFEVRICKVERAYGFGG